MVSVTDLQYVALAVPDLAAERTFFGQTWGLTEVAEEGGKVYFAAEGREHPYVIVLREDVSRAGHFLARAIIAAIERRAVDRAQFLDAPDPNEGL